MVVDTKHLHVVANSLQETDPERTGVAKLLHQAADTIDRQAALIAKYEEVLRQYADHGNWALTPDEDGATWPNIDAHDRWLGNDEDGWQDGWKIAENALKGVKSGG